MRKIFGVVIGLCSASAMGGGSIVDEQSKLAFTYDNVTHEVAQQELAQCQSIANQTLSEVHDTTSGSGVRGARRLMRRVRIVSSIRLCCGTA